jgi:hypothetical protein
MPDHGPYHHTTISKTEADGKAGSIHTVFVLRHLDKWLFALSWCVECLVSLQLYPRCCWWCCWCDVSELLLADNGAEEDGKFLFRARVGTKEHILSVIYKGSGTHHKVTPDDTGLLQINGQPTGTATIVEVSACPPHLAFLQPVAHLLTLERCQD